MRILQVVPVFSDVFGGPVAVVRAISKEIAKRHDVVIYTTAAIDLRHDSDPRVEKRDGYTVVYFPRNLKILSYTYLFGQLNISLGMMKAIIENLKDFDVVHLHSWRQFPDIIVHNYATNYGVPYVLQAHGSLPRIMAKRRLKWLYDVLFGYRLLRDASRVIALSKVEAEQYRSMGVSEEKIAIIPNGIDLSEYASLPPKGQFKKKFNIPEDKKIVLYLGRIHKTKGIDFLVKAYAYLTKKMDFKDVVLVIAGPDDGYLYEVKSLVRLLEISDGVLFTGMLSKNDKVNAYVDSTICAYLGPYEPFGLVPLEAAASFKPVIVADGTVMSQIVKQGGFGLSVRYGEIYELAEVMKRMIIDDDLSERMGQNGRKYVFENCGLANIAVELEKVYEEIIRASK